MKLDDLKDLKDLDAMFPSDPFEIYCYGGGDDGKKKKKGKKDGKKDDGISFKESLHDLSKKELRKKAEAMGVDMRFVDADSKKSLRHAILDARKASKGSGSKKDLTLVASGPAGLAETDEEDDVKTVLTEEVAVQKERPKYYFDMKSHDFVIPNADDADDLTLIDAMKCLGAIRRDKRPEDGFGELMIRLDLHLTSGVELGEALDPKTAIGDGKVIEVDDFTVHDADDAKAALPPKHKHKK